MSRYIGRENVHKRLADLEGQPAHAIYENGVLRLELAQETLVARPPFPLEHEAEYETADLGPFFESLDQDHVVGVLLARLGSYAVGVLDGERLVASKVGSRFVKGRHKKGGSSANRFRRRREEQARAFAAEAAEVAENVLDPWRERIEFVALGGHRATVDSVLAARPTLAWLRHRELPRFFDVPDPRRQVLEGLAYDLYSAELTVGD